MAQQTPISYRNLTIYQIFTRQFSSTHDFQGIINDLDRLESLGIDVIYLLPIHPIGQLDRKGRCGSPYAIYDYYAIDPTYGDFNSFKQLVEEVHQRGMKIMIDLVFNHTARDSVLTEQYPDWFYRHTDGSLANRVGDWSDIADLDFSHHELWDYFIDVMMYWAGYVDGFRCDVAPLIPIDFWLLARQKLDQQYPHLIWLSESVDLGFIKYLRDLGYDASSDSMIYQAFDIAYDYDIYFRMDDYLKHPSRLNRWLEAINRQESIYPKNYVKLRAFENHDQPRLSSKTKNQHQLIHLTAMQFFLKGASMIYAGQEHQIKVKPNLFEYDEIKWHPQDSIESLLKVLIQLKKDMIFSEGIFTIYPAKKVVLMSYQYHNRMIFGIFNPNQQESVKVPFKDGRYINLLTQTNYKVQQQTLNLKDEPIYFEIFID